MLRQTCGSYERTSLRKKSLKSFRGEWKHWGWTPEDVKEAFERGQYSF